MIFISFKSAKEINNDFTIQLYIKNNFYRKKIYLIKTYFNKVV